MLYAGIFVPDFSLQALFAAKPKLRTVAVAIVDGESPLLRVVAANDRALQAGIVPGVLKAQAEIAGAFAVVRSPQVEQEAHDSLVACANDTSPRIQDRAIDLIVADIDGLRMLFGPPELIAIRLRKALLEKHLAANVAVAPNPDTAVIAARGRPGISIVSAPRDIAPLPVTLLSPSSEILETLTLWGIETLGELGALDSAALSQRLGQEGVLLQRLARGEQVTPFLADEKKLEFWEQQNFEHSIELLDPLSFVFSCLLEKICASLSTHALSTNEVEWELALDPPRIARENLDDLSLFHRRTLKLPTPTTDHRLLLRLIQLELQSQPPTAPVTSVSLRAHAVPPRHMQQELFVPQAPDPEKIELTIARLANLVGKEQVGSPEVLDTHRPRAFVMGKFEPASLAKRSTSRAEKPSLALRLFDPAKAASIKLRAGVPYHVGFDSKWGEVIDHSAPWLSSGEWWNEWGWSRKEWDVHIKFSDGSAGDFRIFIDLLTNQSYVEGIYD